MTSTAENQWVFAPSDFASTPSRIQDGISAPQELRERNDGVHYMLRCGNQLKLSVHAYAPIVEANDNEWYYDLRCSKSNVLATAATYFHRVYMRYSFGPSGCDKKARLSDCLYLNLE